MGTLIPDSLQWVDIQARINKETMDLNSITDEMELKDIDRIFYPAGEYTFFSSTHGTFSKRDRNVKPQNKSRQIHKD